MSEKAPPKAKKSAATEYVVLEMHVVEIKNHNQKLEKVIEAVVGSRPGTYKAVAARSWKGGEARKQEMLITSMPLEEGT